MITIKVTDTKTLVDTQHLKKDAQRILNLLDYSDYALGIWLATNSEIQKFNKEFRHTDKPTDILSFPYHEIAAGARIEPKTNEDRNLGDLIIAPEYVKNTLAQWSETNLYDRIRVLLIHGICHLLGYDHIKDKDYKVMKEKEDWLLEHLNK